MQELLRDRLDREPDGRSLTFLGPDEVVAWRSFSEIYTAAAGRGAALTENGVGEGGRACVIVLRSHEFCAEAVLGCLLVGALPVLIAPPVVGGLHSNLREIVEHVVRATDARLVLMDEEEAALKDEFEARNRGQAGCGGGPASARAD